MEHFDWSKARDVAEFLVIIWGCISGGIVLWLQGQFVTRKIYEAEVKRLDQSIVDCRTLSRDDTNGLKLQLAEQKNVLARLDERSKSMKETADRTAEAVARMDGFLLTGRVA